jgi:DNA adenine methylase
MRYIGGKSRIAGKIAEAILSDTPERNCYLEPFLGGGAVFAKTAPFFSHTEASDSCPDLMLMWKRLRDGWIPENYISEQDYNDLRNAQPSAWRGIAGFGASFGGKWLGGYARGKKEDGTPRNYLDETVRNVLKIAPAMKKTLLYCMDYRLFDPCEGTVVYCDPPYAGTQEYGAVESFDSDEFWACMDYWRENGAHVYVSEYRAPDNWKVLAEFSSRRNLALPEQGRPERTERLFY